LLEVFVFIRDSFIELLDGFYQFVVRFLFSHKFVSVDQWPNKSPEPTAVGAVSSAVAVHVTSRRWLSFFR
jgi:hypothetical protein